jgi:PAT family beta-lactamase induction signal transducer AmpG
MIAIGERTEPRTPLWLYGVLDIPYGVVTTGLFTTSMAFLLARSGMKTGEIASTLALMNLPITFYFLYAPIVDFLMRRKVWAALVGSGAGVLGGAGLWELGRSVHWAVVLLFFASALATLVSAASGGMMASLLNKEEKARVGGWIQGGNLGAGSLVGGLLLYLAAKHGNGLLGAVVVGTCVLPALCALAVREPHREKRVERLGETFRGLGQEMKGMFFNWKNVPGMLVLASPVGTGAMQSLMGGLTKQYGATETQLAFASGWGGGLLTAAGSLCAILWPARLNRMVPYIGSSVLYMAIMAAVAMGPMRASTLVLGVLASNFATGLCYGCYTGLVLQTLGEGGRRQSSRYTLLNAVGNLPIVYMLWLCGRVAERFGPRSIAGFDALMNAATILLFGVWWWTLGSREGRVGV